MVAKRSLQDTFAIFEDPYNLAKITPPWLSFKVTSKEHVIMRKGAEIEYTISWLGLPMRWKTLILEYEPPFLFVDEQAKGPYALWRHRHTFLPEPEGTRVTDQVEYALPLGPLGVAAHAVVVRKQLKEIFNYRQRELAKLLGGSAATTMEPVVTG